ncbi:MAG: bifunctional phosphoribosyl-AMP cyclohydrolase/phosphoribosyl-ATP diphosphatase HisIE [Lachnospiraceae bacterium]|nr:bifunctional phosphoribosyl-AMP cyclohydrolase/phosphoribosyl-ATP diphosphatase HisIE [Lachnospiraceae bacterium]
MIPAVYLKNGIVYADSSCVTEFSCEDNCSAARYYSNQGAEAFAAIEFSDTDAEHDLNIGCMKQLAAEAEIPFYAGGYVKRFEDIKKYLYTGADKALFFFCDKTQENALSEASARFGKDKLILCGDADELGSHEKEALTYAGMLCVTNGELKEASLPVISPVSGTDAAQRMSKTVLKPALSWSELTLNSDGMIPVIVQDYKTNQVLMLAYMNEEAYNTTLATGKMTYYSRSRKELWMKGLTSGHFQYVKELSADCDKDTLLAKVSQIGAACHTGSYSCFFNEIAKKDYRITNPLEVFEKEYATILDRKEHPKEGSYTNYLFDKGIDKILKKVGEEATEIIIAAKNPDPEEIKYEISDFLYHVMVLMAEKGVTWDDITKEISNR